MRWFFKPTLALPLKLLLLAWLLYATVVAAGGAVLRIAAAATVTMAVLGLIATVLLFPILLGVIGGAVVAYGAPLALLPRLWRQERSRAAKMGLTVVLVVGTALAGYFLNAVAVRSITWIADRNPCAAFHAGVTGTVRPSDECMSRAR